MFRETKRILLCTPEYPPYGSGIARVAYNLASGLRNRGLVVNVLSRRSGDVLVCRRFNRLPGIVGLLPFWIGVLLYASSHKEKYDVLWLQQPFLIFPGGVAKSRLPVLMTWHATYYGLFFGHSAHRIWYLLPYYFVAYMLERLSLTMLSKLASKVVVTAVSPPASLELAANGLRSEVRVIPNASRFADTPRVSKSDARERLRSRFGINLGIDDKVAISVGRVTPGKRPLELLRFFEKMRGGDSRFKLLIVGSGSLLPEVRRQARGKSGIHVLGYVPDSELPALYQASDVYLSLSPHEAFNLSAVEAASFALPTLLSDISSHRWLLESGRVKGITINSSTTRDDMLKVLEAWKITSQDRVSAELSWDDVSESYLALIEEVISEERV